jgi:hypothetical protein
MTFTTIEQLASRCATELGVGTADPLHPAFCSAKDWGGGIAEQRRVVDLVCGQGVQYLDAKKPGRTSRDEERFQRRVRRRAEKIVRERDVDKTGFAPLILIGGAIISWLIGKALDWLLRWWRGDDQAPASVAAICDVMPGVGWRDDGDDGEDE